MGFMNLKNLDLGNVIKLTLIVVVDKICTIR